jgi:hypothetical protein
LKRKDVDACNVLLISTAALARYSVERSRPQVELQIDVLEQELSAVIRRTKIYISIYIASIIINLYKTYDLISTKEK